MADTFSTAKLGLGVDTKDFSKQIDSVSDTTERALENMKNSADAFSAKWSDLTAGIKDTKRIISGILVSQGFYTISQGLADAATAALDFSKNMETAQVSLEYFVQGADKAQKAAAYLRTMNTFAAKTPFTTEQTLALSKYMQAVGVSMNTTKSFLQVITDTASATGATEENLQRIVFGLGQMMTKGRLANEEIRQLANANIPIYQILQEELGLTGTQISNIGKYWVSSDKAVVAILNGLQKRYAGAADKISDTVTGMTDTIIDDAKIIMQTATGGAFDTLADKMTNLRDTMDAYRETVTAKGSAGLFDQILRDMDASGEIGTYMLALVGNTRQLGEALKETYIDGKPLVDLLGKSLYASISTMEITMTAMTEVADGLINGLNKLGITTGTTAEVLASLFVAYKAAKWMAFLGQGATAAAYSMYQTVSAASAILPATVQASAGTKLLATSLAGLVTYGLAAFGIFKMLNSSMAGLSTTTSGNNLFPDDYSEAMDNYNAQMADYNEQIAKYQESYETPYTAISDGSDAAVDGLNKVASTSKKTAKAVKNDWTASFDEVFSIPDQNASGAAGTAAKLPDFGASLIPPKFAFPDVSAKLEKPEFPWSDVFDKSPLNSDVLSGDWWKSLLPFVIAGGAVQLGKIFADGNKAVEGTINDAANKVSDTILADREAQKAAFKSITNNYDDLEGMLTKTLNELRNPRLPSESRELLERNLTKLVTAGQKTVEQLGDVQDALLLTGSARRTTTVFDIAKQQDSLNKLNRGITHIEELTAKLADNAFAQSAAGKATLTELKELKAATKDQYIKYAGSYGSDDVVEELAKSIGLSMPSIGNSLAVVKNNITELVGIAENGFEDVNKAQALLKSTRGTLTSIASDTAALGINLKGLDSLKAQLTILGNGIAAANKTTVSKELLGAVRRILSNSDALSEIGILDSNAKKYLDEISVKYAQDTLENKKIADAISGVAVSFDDLRAETLGIRQLQLNANKTFTKTIDSVVNRQLPSILAELRTIDKYGVGILRQTVEGRNLLRIVDKNIDIVIKSLDTNTQLLKQPLEDIKVISSKLLNSNTVVEKLFNTSYSNLSKAIVAAGNAAKADTTTVNAAIDRLAYLVKETNVSTNNIEASIKQLGVSATTRAIAPTTDPFVSQSDAVFTELLRSSKSAEQFESKLNDALDGIVRQLAKQSGVNYLDLTDKYAKQIDEMLNGAAEAFRYNASDNLGGLRITKSDFEQAVATIGNDLAALPTEQADAIGKGVRSDAYGLLDKLEASNSDEWKNFVSTLRAGGVFDINKSLTTGGDFGAAMLGQTSFGRTAYDVLIGNLLKGPLASSFPKNTATATNMTASITGTEAEELAKRVLSKYLAATDKVLYKTSTYVDQTRKILVQLDSAIGDKTAAQMPTDIKVLSDSSYAKLVDIATAIGKNVDGKTIQITADGFKEMLKVAPDYALQIAAQADVLGTSNAALAIFNRETSGLIKTLGDVSKIDVTSKSGVSDLQAAVRSAIMDGIKDADVVEKFSDSLRLLTFDIPDDTKVLVHQIADNVRSAELAISKFAVNGASIEDLIYALSNKTAEGSDVGLAGVYRYIGQNFTWSRKSIAEINQAVGKIEPLLKSGNASLAEVGMTRLRQIEDILRSTLEKNQNIAKTTDELAIKMPAMKLGGGTVEFTATADEILQTIKDLDTYSKVITGYNYALVTQFNDAVRQLEELRDTGKTMVDTAYTTIKDGKETKVLVADIAQRAANNARTLEEIYNITDRKISRQLMQMIDQGTIGTLNNPFQIANASQIAQIVDKFETGVSKISSIPTVTANLGNAVTTMDKQVDETVSALRLGAASNYEAAEMLKKGSAAFAEATADVKGIAGTVKEATESGVAATKTAAGALESGATATKEAATATSTAAANTTRAAENTAKAADAVYTAAAKLGTKANVTLTDDDLAKLFNDVIFDASQKYTIVRNEGAQLVSADTSGARLAAAQTGRKNAFLHTDIYDELGNLIYTPAYDNAEEALTDFFKLIDELPNKTEMEKVFNLVDGTDILRANVAALNSIIDAGKIAKVGNNITEQLTEAFKGLDVGEELQKTISEATGDLGKEIAHKLAKAGAMDSTDIGDIGSALAKQIGDRLAGDNSEVAESIASTVRKVIVNNSNDFADTFSSNASITDELSKGMDKFFENAGSISDDVFDTASKTIATSYKSLGDDLTKNILTLTDGDIPERSMVRIKKYLDSVIDDGLGVASDDVTDYLQTAVKLIDHKSAKTYADEISQAVDLTLKDTTKTITDALGSITPEIKIGKEATDLAGEGATAATKAAAAAAKTGKSGLTASDILLGGSAGVGLLDVASLGLDAHFSNKESKQISGNVTDYMKSIATDNVNLSKAMDIIAANNTDLSKMAADGTNWFTAMFGSTDLNSAAYKSVGANAGITIAQGVSAGMTAALATAAWPAATAAAIVGGGGSAIYELTGGNSIGNKYTGAYVNARNNDTIYKNAVSQGMTDKEARAYSDAAMQGYAKTIFSDLSDNFWKKDDLNAVLYGYDKKSYDQAATQLSGGSDLATANRMLRLQQALGDKQIYTVQTKNGEPIPIKYSDAGSASAERGATWQKMVQDSKAQGLSGTLYQTGNTAEMKDLLDYIFKGGNYNTDIATEFFKNYGGTKEMDYLKSSEYGKFMEAYDNVGAFVDMLNKLGDTNIDLAQLMSENKLGSVIQSIVNFKQDFDSSLASELQVYKDYSNPAKGADSVHVKREYQWNTSDADKSDDQAAEAIIKTFTGLNATVKQKLNDDLGITIDSTVRNYKNSADENIKELYSAVSVNYAKLRDSVSAWTVKLPENISLDGASLSANDISVLAQAGIQINSDGTITFAKAQNANTTGTDRETSLTLDDVSKNILDKLATKGLSFADGTGGLTLDLKTSDLSKNMSSALFKLSTDLSSGMSTDMSEALSGLGKVLDSGYFQITNKAVLNGQTTISQYINSMGKKADELSPEVRKALGLIDDQIAQGGKATAQTVAQWADGIVIKSPIDADALTPEIETAFGKIGVTFETQGSELMMVINHLGDQLADGTTLIPATTWDTLNQNVKDGLKQLGVTWTEEAGFVKVDISNTLGSLVTTNDIQPVKDALNELGITFETSGNRITEIAGNKGLDIKNNLLTIATSIWDTVDPSVKTALEGLGVTMTTSGDKTMVDFNSVVSNGIGDVVALFTAQPDFWNQIPDAVKQTLEDAGLATQDGMLKISRYTIEGLMPIGNDWAGYWENMPEDVRTAFADAGLNTKNGLFTVKEYLDESSVPEGVKHLIMKFDELPKSVQDDIIASGKAISDKGYVVYNATASTMKSVSEAINDNKTAAVDAANDMATQIASAVTSAMQNIQRLNNIKIGKTGGFLGIGGTKNTIGSPVASGGITYYPEYTAAGDLVKYHYYDNRGIEHTTTSIRSKAKGGVAAGLTLTGELGRELAVLPDGSLQMLGKDTGELVNLPTGTRVINNDDTEKIMKYTDGLSGVSNVRQLADGNTAVKVGTTAVDFNSAALSFFTAVLEQLKNSDMLTAAELDSVVKTIIAEESDNSKAFSDLLGIINATIGASSDALKTTIDTLATTLTTTITTVASDVADSLTQSLSSIQTSAAETAKVFTDTNSSGSYGMSIDEAAAKIAAAKDAAENPNSTIEERNIAHQVAEQVRSVFGYSGGARGDQNIGGSQSIVESINSRVDEIRGSAAGSLIKGDALYRAGENNRYEAILPLERPEIMQYVGSTIADNMPTVGGNTSLTGNNENFYDSILTYLAGILTQQRNSDMLTAAELDSAVKTVTETNNDAIADIKTLISELSKATTSSGTDVVTALNNNTGTLGTKLDAIINTVNTATSSLSSTLSSLQTSAGYQTPVLSGYGGGSGSSDSGMSIDEAASRIAAAKDVAENPNSTAEERATAHQAAEQVRSEFGYSGGALGDKATGNTSVANAINSKVDSIRGKGSAAGSVISGDAYYRAGENNKRETILPLERPEIMHYVGAAIADSMPVQYTDMLKSAVGMKNAGIADMSSGTRSQDLSSMVGTITQKVLEGILPAMSATGEEQSKTPVYVGTLIADDSGLKQLERKLYVIRQTEQERR